MPPSVYSPRWTPPEEEETHICDMPGCEEVAKHIAPKSRYSPLKKEHYRFCQKHAAEYNKQWNYFQGMSEMEIEMYWADYDTAHRPTWKREGGSKDNLFTTDSLYESFTRKFGDVFNGKGDASIDDMASQIPAPSRKVTLALRALELRWPVSKDQVKRQFKSLVKQYHPDINKEAKAEDRFKRITESYAVVMEELAQYS
jgi:hypothetical protein